MDPAAEATIVQLLPLLADEAVYTASLPRLARVAQLGSELASQRQQLAAGVTQMLERCSEEYVFIKETAQRGVESELLRTNSTAQKNRPEALAKIAKDVNCDPNMAFVALEARTALVQEARDQVAQLAARQPDENRIDENKYVTSSGKPDWLPAHLKQIAADASLDLLVQNEAIEMVSEYEAVLTTIMGVGHRTANLTRALDTVHADLTDRCDNFQMSPPEREPRSEDPAHQTLDQACKVLELCRPAIRWATQCKLQNAQKELSEAMMSGDAVIVRQAQESYTRKMDESQHDGLVGSSVDLDEFQLKIGQLEGLQKRELDRHNAWKNSTELATILEAQAELSERIRGLVGQGEDPEVIGLERFAEQLRIEQKEGKSCGTTGRICKCKGTCKWLKIKLQVSAATKQKQALTDALRGEMDSDSAQSAIDRVSEFYGEKTVSNADTADLDSGWYEPLEVIKILRVAEQYIKTARSNQVMDSEEAQMAMRRGKQTLGKLIASGADKDTVDKAIEQMTTNNGKQWPGGQPPIEFLAEISTLLGSGKVKSEKVNNMIFRTNKMISATLGIQRAFRAFKVRAIIKKRAADGVTDLTLEESRRLYGAAGMPNQVLRDPREAKQSSTHASSMNKALKQKAAHSKMLREEKLLARLATQEDRLRDEFGNELEEARESWENNSPRHCVDTECRLECDEQESGKLMNIAVLRLRHAGDKVSAQRKYEELMDEYEKLQAKYKELEEREHQSKLDTAAAETATAVKEAELESQKLQLEQLSEGRALSDAQQGQAQKAFDERLKQLEQKTQNEIDLINENAKHNIEEARQMAREATDTLHEKYEENEGLAMIIEQLNGQVQSMLADHQSDITLNKLKQDQYSEDQQRKHENDSQILRDQISDATQGLIEAQGENADMHNAISAFQHSMHALQEQLKKQLRERNEEKEELQSTLEQQAEDQVRQVEEKYKKQMKEAHDLSQKKRSWFQGNRVPKNAAKAPEAPAPWFRGQPAAKPVVEEVVPESPPPVEQPAVSPKPDANPMTATASAMVASICSTLNQLQDRIRKNEAALAKTRKMRHAGQDDPATAMETPIADGHPLLSALQATFVALDKGMRDVLDVDALCDGLVTEACENSLDQHLDVQHAVNTISGLHLNQEFCYREFSFTEFCETLFLCQRLLLEDGPAKSELRWFHFQRSFGSETRYVESRNENAQCSQHPLSPPAWHWEETGPLTGDGIDVIREKYYAQQSFDF